MMILDARTVDSLVRAEEKLLSLTPKPVPQGVTSYDYDESGRLLILPPSYVEPLRLNTSIECLIRDPYTKAKQERNIIESMCYTIRAWPEELESYLVYIVAMPSNGKSRGSNPTIQAAAQERLKAGKPLYPRAPLAENEKLAEKRKSKQDSIKQIKSKICKEARRAISSLYPDLAPHVYTKTFQVQDSRGRTVIITPTGGPILPWYTQNYIVLPGPDADMGPKAPQPSMP